MFNFPTYFSCDLPVFVLTILFLLLHRAKTELLEILGSHKLPDDVVEKIVYWKEH